MNPSDILKSAINIIEVCAKRGAYSIDEFPDIYAVRNGLKQLQQQASIPVVETSPELSPEVVIEEGFVG